jgi:hypothetical protein
MQNKAKPIKTIQNKGEHLKVICNYFGIPKKDGILLFPSITVSTIRARDRISNILILSHLIACESFPT